MKLIASVLGAAAGLLAAGSAVCAEEPQHNATPAPKVPSQVEAKLPPLIPSLFGSRSISHKDPKTSFGLTEAAVL